MINARSDAETADSTEAELGSESGNAEEEKDMEILLANPSPGAAEDKQCVRLKRLEAKLKIQEDPVDDRAGKEREVGHLRQEPHVTEPRKEKDPDEVTRPQQTGQQNPEG